MLGGMDASDIIAIVATSGTVLSFGVAGWALIYARSQAATAKDALAASQRAATAGEHSAEAAATSATEARRSAEAAEEANRIASRALELAEPPAVAWRVEHIQNSAYHLRNVGTEEATGVTVDMSRIDTSHRNLPNGATIAAGDVVRFILSNARGSLFLSWDGQADPVAVAVP